MDFVVIFGLLVVWFHKGQGGSRWGKFPQRWQCARNHVWLWIGLRKFLVLTGCCEGCYWYTRQPVEVDYCLKKRTGKLKWTIVTLHVYIYCIISVYIFYLLDIHFGKNILRLAMDSMFFFFRGYVHSSNVGSWFSVGELPPPHMAEKLEEPMEGSHDVAVALWSSSLDEAPSFF